MREDDVLATYLKAFDSAGSSIGATARKNAIAVGSGTPSSARGCRIAEITGSNARSGVISSAIE